MPVRLSDADGLTADGPSRERPGEARALARSSLARKLFGMGSRSVRQR